MIRNIMQLRLSVIEFTTIFHEIIKLGNIVTLTYNSKSDIRIGVDYSIEIEDVYCSGNVINLIFSSNNDGFTIMIPAENNGIILCKVVHDQIKDIDYDKLSDRDKQDYIYDQLDKKGRNFEKLTRNEFELSFDNFSFQFNIEAKILYDIIGNLEKYTRIFSRRLAEINDYDEKVDIDGFEESINDH